MHNNKAIKGERHLKQKEQWKIISSWRLRNLTYNKQKLENQPEILLEFLNVGEKNNYILYTPAVSFQQRDENGAGDGSVVRACTALAEEPCSVTSTHIRQLPTA